MAKPVTTETKNGIPAFYAKDAAAWRRWLEKNSGTARSVCLILYHKKSKVPCLDISEAMEQALCFGWIDSKAMNRDEESTYLTFTPRKPKSNWSRVNKDRVEKLTALGLMTARGQALIDLAKTNGAWDALNDAEKGIIPEEMQKLFNKNKTALTNFQAFSASVRRLTLEWILKAKRPETRLKRIEEAAALAAQNKKAI